MSSVMRLVFLLMVVFMPMSAWAVDSYRYAHVTIETPWSIFVFLLLVILLPFILMAILYWHFASRKHEAKDGGTDQEH